MPDRSFSLAIDKTTVDEDIYMAGGTNSHINISANGHQNSHSSGSNNEDAFLAKFNKDGVRIWATYYGGTGLDRGLSVCVDNFGYVYLAGYTASNSPNFEMYTLGAH